MMSLGSRKAAVALPFGLPDAVNQSPLKPIMDVVGVKLVSATVEWTCLALFVESAVWTLLQSQ